MHTRLLVAAVLVGGMLPLIAFAQTATDLMCTGCVNSTDIQNNTITNADITGMANINPSKISGTAWTGSNDGSGSGLDADVLDGIESVVFLRSDQSGSVAGTLDVTQLRVDTANMNTTKIILYGSESSGYHIGTESGGGIVHSVDVADANHFHDFRFGGMSAFKIFGDGNATLTTETNNTSGNAELRIQAQNTDNDRSAVLRFMPSGTGGSIPSGGNKAILRLDATSTAATPWGFDFQNTAGSSIFGITNDGKVGVGTTEPDTKLHLYGASPDLRIEDTDDMPTLFFDDSGSSSRANIRVGDGSSSDNEEDALYINSINDDIIFQTGSFTSEIMSIGGNGNVTIGTPTFTSGAAPELNITAYDTSSAAGLGLQSVDGTSSLYLRSGTGSGDASLIAFQNQLNIGETSGTGTSGFSTKVTINADGYVGIAGASAAKPLTINAGANDPIYMMSDANHNWYFGPNVGGQRFGIYDQTDTSMKMYVDSNGDMCLGDCN